jgi:short chain dehydrogenase
MTATTQLQTNQKANADKLMSDRVILVTGASRGIGAATAKLLGRQGAAVGVNYYTNEVAAQEIVDEITSIGGKALPVKADVRDQQQVEAMVQQVVEAFGPIDTLVANANAAFFISPFIDTPWEDFEAKLLGELKGTFFPCKAVVPLMITPIVKKCKSYGQSGKTWVCTSFSCPHIAPRCCLLREGYPIELEWQHLKKDELCGQIFDDELDLAYAVMDGVKARGEKGNYSTQRIKFNSKHSG